MEEPEEREKRSCCTAMQLPANRPQTRRPSSTLLRVQEALREIAAKQESRKDDMCMQT